MTSFYYLTAVVLLMCRTTTTFVHESSTSEPGKNTGCHLQVNKSKIEEILSKRDKSTATNTVKIKVSVVPGNKTRYYQELELPWASEIGRTIISLVRLGKETIFTSPIFTLVLEVGTEEVDIQVSEETDGCLPPGDEGSVMIFDSLLRQLSHSKDKHFFKLCRAKDESIQYATYNCCRVIGDRGLVVCADYSSAAVKFALPTVIIVFIISYLMVVPFVLEYIITYPTIEIYKTSYSHMSLVSIVSRKLFEGREPTKSFFGRCVFAGISYLCAFYPDFFGCLGLKIVFGLWAGVFVFVYDGDIMGYVGDDGMGEPKLDKKVISIFKKPFSCSCILAIFACSSKLHKCKWLSDNIKKCRICRKCNFLQESLYGLFIFLESIGYVILLVIAIFIFLLNFIFIDVLFCFAFLQCNRVRIKFEFEFFCTGFIRLLTFVNIVFFTSMILMFSISLVVGLTLNGEYFGPYIALILTLLVYFWKNWKISVEEKYLQLKTSIIEVCKEQDCKEQDVSLETSKKFKEDKQDSENRRGRRNVRTRDTNPQTTKQLLIEMEPLIGQTNLGPDYGTSTTKKSELNIDQGQRSTGEVTETCIDISRSDDKLSTLKTPEIVENNAENADMDKDDHDVPDHVMNISLHNLLLSPATSSDEQQKVRKDQNSDAKQIHASTTENRGTEGNTLNLKSGYGENAELANVDQNGVKDHNFIIILNDDEAEIPKEIYDEIRKKIPSLDNLLFYFFRRVIFVGLYAIVLANVMIVAQESGVSESVQVISAIAGAMMPVIFETIFADHHLSQRNARNMATKEKLEHILKVIKRQKDKIFVILINNNKDESRKD